ncbi:MAG: hypothetical protein KAX31_06400 [Thermoplasmata archaeon]|nr:hypothetical protein [Thermoplasmata archaeon]
MTTDITSIRLPTKDAVMLEHFVDKGDFKSKSEFIRYAIKKTINEMILREFHEKLSEPTDEKKIKQIQKEIKNIRKQLWEDYAKHLS